MSERLNAKSILACVTNGSGCHKWVEKIPRKIQSSMVELRIKLRIFLKYNMCSWPMCANARMEPTLFVVVDVVVPTTSRHFPVELSGRALCSVLRVLNKIILPFRSWAARAAQLATTSISPSALLPTQVPARSNVLTRNCWRVLIKAQECSFLGRRAARSTATQTLHACMTSKLTL
jgi:hypothetical protein